MDLNMITRVLYLPAGTRPDLHAGRAAAARLAAAADPHDLHRIVNEGWLNNPPGSTHTGSPAPDPQLRHTITGRLDQLPTEAWATATFGSWQVDRYRLDHGEHPGVQVHTTGGPHGPDSTRAYHAWDILTEHHRLPAGWAATINHAIGFIDPYANGPAAATVTFRTWR
jgi:hypothetical protein